MARRLSNLHVAHLINNLASRGGVTRVLWELGPRLNRLAGRHCIVCLDRGGEGAEEFAAAGIPVHVAKLRGQFDRRGIRALRRWLKAEGVNCLQAEMPETVIPAWLANRGLGAALLVQGHGIWDEYWDGLSWPVRWLHQRAVRRADRILAVSQTVSNVFQQVLKLPPERVALAPNGVCQPPPGFDREKARAAVREKLGITPDAPVIGLVGRPCRAKRLTDFVRAAAIVSRSHPEARFVILGTGKQKYIDKLRNAIRRNSLEEVVLWEGDRPNPDDYLAAFDIGVLCSEREGFGLALVEYLAHGLPVVVTDIPALRELVREGENGVFAEVRNPESLAQGMLSILEDAELAARLRENAPASVTHLSWDRTAELLAAVYRDLADE